MAPPTSCAPVESVRDVGVWSMTTRMTHYDDNRVFEKEENMCLRWIRKIETAFRKQKINKISHHLRTTRGDWRPWRALHQEPNKSWLRTHLSDHLICLTLIKREPEEKPALSPSPQYKTRWWCRRNRPASVGASVSVCVKCVAFV